MYGGIQNLGATCAINTLLQMVSHSSRLRDSIMDAYRTNRVNADTITWQVCDVINKLHYEKQSVAPVGLLNLIYKIYPMIKFILYFIV